MNANTIILFIAGFIMIAVLGFFFLSGGWDFSGRQPAVPAPTPAPAPAPPPAGGPAPAGAGPTTHAIAMTAGGFQPATLTIKAGEAVVFENRDTRQHWPASGVHPTHLLCPGFDALRPLAAGETYSHTFTEAKNCPMHDHLIPTLTGRITVTE